MNPLFTAHLVADFLLQPTWLVDLKNKRAAGVILHSAIHAAVLTLLVWPNRLNFWIYLLAIGISHGVIDYVKIQYGKRHPEFGIPFILDQAAHLVILIVMSFFVPFHPLWHTETGRGILLLLMFFSLGFAFWNLSNRKRFALKNPAALSVRWLLVGAIFIAYFIPSKLLGASACFGPG